ncbi:MAG: hypothetical protein IKQ70_01520 [Bacteroidales bacterium]|nr:hypothetical protein [Bacteroidales bacterium]
MKRIKSLIISAAVIISATGIQSCNNAPYQKTNAKNRLASVTQQAITDMSEIYANIEDVTITNEFDNALAGVLSNQELNYNPIAATNETLREKITIFNLYRIAVHEYSKLTSAESNLKSLAPFSNACSSITKKFSNSQDTVLVNIANSINSYISSQRFNIDQVMKLLINSLDIIWQNDTKNWNNLLNESFTSYQDAINNIPEESFNEEKLAKYVYQPYEGKTALVQAYKLNLIKERYDYIRGFVNSQDNITIALKHLCEVSKALLNVKDIEQINNDISKAEAALNSVNYGQNNDAQ